MGEERRASAEVWETQWRTAHMGDPGNLRKPRPLCGGRVLKRRILSGWPPPGTAHGDRETGRRRLGRRPHHPHTPRPHGRTGRQRDDTIKEKDSDKDNQRKHRPCHRNRRHDRRLQDGQNLTGPGTSNRQTRVTRLPRPSPTPPSSPCLYETHQLFPPPCPLPFVPLSPRPPPFWKRSCPPALRHLLPTLLRRLRRLCRFQFLFPTTNLLLPHRTPLFPCLLCPPSPRPSPQPILTPKPFLPCPRLPTSVKVKLPATSVMFPPLQPPSRPSKALPDLTRLDLSFPLPFRHSNGSTSHGARTMAGRVNSRNPSMSPFPLILGVVAHSKPHELAVRWIYSAREGRIRRGECAGGEKIRFEPKGRGRGTMLK